MDSIKNGFLATKHSHFEILGGLGFNLNNKFVSQGLLTRYHTAIEIKFGVNSNEQKAWHKLYNYPIFGFGILSNHLSKDTRIGNPFSVFSFINFPLISCKFYSGSFNLKGGLSFFRNNQGITILPDNPLLGSKINAIIGLNYNSNFQITPSLSMVINVGLTHFSNGRIQTPNPGINLIGAKIGTKINFSSNKSFSPPTHYEVSLFSTTTNQLLFSINTGTVTNYIRGLPGYRYLTFSSYIDWVKKYSDRGNFVIGTDLFYDSSSGENTNIRISLPRSTKFFMGLHIGHELKIGRLSIMSHFGIYYLKGSQLKGNIYSRLGLKYRVWQNTYGIVALKTTDGLSADFIEFGLGYAFSKKKH